MNNPSSRNNMRSAVWACSVVMAAIASALPFLYGWSWWTLLLAAVLLACPVAIVWTVLRFGRKGPFPPIPSNERRKP